MADSSPFAYKDLSHGLPALVFMRWTGGRAVICLYLPRTCLQGFAIGVPVALLAIPRSVIYVHVADSSSALDSGTNRVCPVLVVIRQAEGFRNEFKMGFIGDPLFMNKWPLVIPPEYEVRWKLRFRFAFQIDTERSVG